MYLRRMRQERDHGAGISSKKSSTWQTQQVMCYPITSLNWIFIFFTIERLFRRVTHSCSQGKFFKHFLYILVPGSWITPLDHPCCEILTSSQLFPAFQCKHFVSCLLVEMLKHKSSCIIIVVWCFRHCQYLKQYLEVSLPCRMLLVSSIISFQDILCYIESSCLSHSNAAPCAGTRSWNTPAISLQPRQPGSLDTKV